jgi:hypothetical protein
LNVRRITDRSDAGNVRRLDRREFIAAAGAALTFLPWAARYALTAEMPGFSAPPLTNPQTLDIKSDNSQGFIQLDPDRDYLIRIGRDTGGVVVRHALRLRGGRNVVMIGGCVKRTPDTPTNAADGTKTRFPGELFNISGHSGTAYVEGLVIDNGDNYGVDGIHVGNSDGTYVFRNVHVRGVTGTKTGNHADGLQVIGAVNTLLIDGMTIYSTYQGMNIQSEFPIGYAWLRNCNLRYPNPDFRSGSANGFSFWLGGDNTSPKLNHPAKYKFDNFYVEERTHFWDLPWENGSIAPPAKEPRGCRLVAGHPDWAEFPNLNVEGHVAKGIPPGGDFCTVAKILNGDGVVSYQAI